MKIPITSILFFMQILFTLDTMAGNECISPFNYGFLEATTDIERFMALERCHKDAAKKYTPISN